MRRNLTGALLYVFALLPFPVIYVLSDLLYLLLYYGIRYRRNVVGTNLRNSFPEKTPAELERTAKKFFRFLCDQILESLKMRTMSRATIRKRFRLNNLEEITRHFKTGKGVIAATGHYGNWEWGTLVITANIEEPVLVIYKPIANKDFEELLNAMRARFGAIMVSMKNTLRQLAAHRHRPFLAVLVSDQTPVVHETHYFTTFLGQSTAVFLGVEKMAKMTDSPVVFCHINKVRRGYYECTFKTLTEDPAATADYALTDQHTRELEEIIRQRPELWLWSHKRWKFTTEGFNTYAK